MPFVVVSNPPYVALDEMAGLSPDVRDWEPHGALTDGAENLECSVRIAARTVTRDGVVAAGGGGFAADWGPFTSASKRAEMAQWVSGQEYCQPAAGEP